MIAWGGALLGFVRGSSTCIDTTVDLSTGLSSDFVLSFFFFFLDISVSVPYFGQLLLRQSGPITHLRYLLLAAQQFPRCPFSFSSSSSYP